MNSACLERETRPLERRTLVLLWSICCAEAALVGFLNYQSAIMPGIVGSYEDFGRIIRNGFDPSFGIHHTPTFPMWGYGVLLMATHARVMLFALQNLLGLIALAVIFHRGPLRRYSPRAQWLFWGLVFASQSWFAIQAGLAPYSIAANLTAASLALAAEGVRQARLRQAAPYVMISAAFFGLALNFRSDFFFFSLVAAGVLVWCARPVRRGVAVAALWLAVVFACLTPWAIYAHSVTGRYLFTSTNTGHVFYIGLGRRPDNPWRITPYDNDPRMLAELTSHYGRPVSSLSREGDVFLKQRFLQLVAQSPADYLRVVSWGAALSLLKGPYLPDYIYPAELREQFKPCNQGCAGWLSRIGARFAEQPDAAGRINLGIRAFMTYLSGGVGIMLNLLAYALSLPMLWIALRRRQPLVMLCSLAMLYQLAVCAFAYDMTLYMTNVILAEIMLVVTAFEWRRRGIAAIEA